MSSVRFCNRLLPILSLGRTVAIIPRVGPYHIGQNITHIRWFHFSPVLISDPPKLRNERRAKQILIPPRTTSIIPITDTPVTTVFSNKCQSLWHRIIHESKHYYHGWKLLCTETKLACGLVRHMVNGHTLTRRERKQFIRTMADLCRLLPFSIFLIVPFMEFTLPIFLKLFPNMLPSTFKPTGKEQEDMKKQSIMKLEVVVFLQETFEETIFRSDKECPKTFQSLRIQPSIEEMIKFSALIGDQFTLDSLHRSPLLALSKLLNLSIIGPNSYLRLKLHLKFHRLKIDDKLLANEGLENLTDEELRSACHERGMNILEADVEQLQSQLQQWLDLHIHHRIPITILLLSSVFYSPPKNRRNATPIQVPDRHIDPEQGAVNGVTQTPIPIDIDRLRMDLDQFIQEKSDWKQCYPNMDQIQRLTTIDSKCIDDLVVHLSQTSDQQRELH